MLELDNGDQVSVKNTYMENSDFLEIDEIDIDKVRVSKKYLYKKEHESYKHYVFYEHNGEYIPIRIILNDMIGYYNKFNNTVSKNMKFALKGNLKDKFYDIFKNIKEKSDIDNIDYVYESGNGCVEYLKTIVSDKTLFDKDDFCTVLSENIKNSCNVALTIQSVYHSTKDKNKDVIYFSQVLLDQCCYDFFVDTRKIDPRLKRKKKVDLLLKRKKKSQTEPEEEINENTVFDE